MRVLYPLIFFWRTRERDRHQRLAESGRRRQSSRRRVHVMRGDLSPALFLKIEEQTRPDVGGDMKLGESRLRVPRKVPGDLEG
jgi:hypothetical protein